MKKIITKIINWAEVDRATFFSVLSRVWSVVAGPITLAIIGARFTKVEQGYYMAFLSVIGYSTYVQFGLGRIIIQFASHEWANLKLNTAGRIVGNSESLSKLSELAKFAIKWFIAGAIIVIIGLSIGGYIFFSTSKQPAVPITWQPQWLILALFVGLDLIFFPLYFLLEGCGEVSYIYQFRFWRGLIGNISIWTAIYLGAGLWTYSVFFLIGFPIILFFIVYKHRNLFKSLIFNKISGKSFDWIREILPLQWQITVISICAYFMFQIFTQSSMYARGPERAGQTAMTWNMILMLGLLMNAFMSPKMPKFGALIAQKKFKEFDKLYFKVYAIGSATLIAGAIAIITGVAVLNYVPYKYFEYYSNRMLPLLPTSIFLFAYIFWVIMTQLGVSYLTAHKKTPHWWIFVSATCFTSVTTWYFGGKYGLTGAGIGLIVVFLAHFPLMFWMWQKCRKEWHRESN